MKEAAAVTRACTQLVDQLFEICLQLEEDEENGIRTRAAEAQARLGHVLHALSLFCAARPSLIVPHIGKLPSYLEYDFCAPAIRHVCEMLPLVVPAIDHPPHALLTKLETFLAALAFRIPEPLLAAGVKALCAVAAASLNHALVRETLSRFCNMIGRADDAAEAERLQKQVCRAMLCAGLLLCHFDYDAPAPAATTYYRTADIVIDGVAIAHGRVHDTVFEMLMLHLESQPASPTALYAFKGLGHACVRRPERVGRCRALLDRSLKPEANEKSKLQALVNLRLLLGAEEERLRALRAAKDGTSAAAIAAAAAADSAEATVAAAEESAAVGGALQQQQQAVLASMLDGRAPAVRREALALVRSVLAQGLAHPVPCLPHVMALELDGQPSKDGARCADGAKLLLRSTYERHPALVTMPTVLDRGLRAARALQRSLPPAERNAPDGSRGSARALSTRSSTATARSARPTSTRSSRCSSRPSPVDGGARRRRPRPRRRRRRRRRPTARRVTTTVSPPPGGSGGKRRRSARRRGAGDGGGRGAAADGGGGARGGAPRRMGGADARRAAVREGGGAAHAGPSDQPHARAAHRRVAWRALRRLRRPARPRRRARAARRRRHHRQGGGGRQ